MFNKDDIKNYFKAQRNGEKYEILDENTRAINDLLAIIRKGVEQPHAVSYQHIFLDEHAYSHDDKCVGVQLEDSIGHSKDIVIQISDVDVEPVPECMVVTGLVESLPDYLAERHIFNDWTERGFRILSHDSYVRLKDTLKENGFTQRPKVYVVGGALVYGEAVTLYSVWDCVKDNLRYTIAMAVYDQ